MRLYALVLMSSALCLNAAAISPPTLPDAKESLEQGLTLTFEQGGNTDVRSARLVSLYVSEGASSSPFLSPGPFTATWTGFLNQRLRGDVTFSVLGRGKVTVKVGGKVVLEAQGDDFGEKTSAAVRLEKGKNPIEVVYASPPKGDAWARLLWASREWLGEPVQPTVLSHDASARPVREAARLREGRELLAGSRCVRCHEFSIPQVDANLSNMPELMADAPNLDEVGARLKAAWMAAWIADPRSLRPDASMPRFIHGKGEKQQAADLAAYLASLGKPADETKKEATDEEVTQGSQLFAALGCIGCHTRPDAEEIDAKYQRVPLKWVNAKFQPGALKAWLLDPQKHYAWARMPNFHFTAFEADRLVAYLTRNAKGEIGEADAGDVGRGKALFSSRGCARCHAIGHAPQSERLDGARGLKELVARADWQRGCLAVDDASRGKAPDFGFFDEQRGALQAIAASAIRSLNNDVPVEFAQRAIRRFQCNACHSRDEVDDRWTQVADEVADLMPPDTNIEGDQNAQQAAAEGPRLFYPANLGKLVGGDQIIIGGEQLRPALTWTGEKLRPDWAEQFIAGKVTYKPRYWLRARMPSFPVQAKLIAIGLANEHGMPPHSPPPPAPTQDLAQIGQKLVGRDGGFACVTCHSVNDNRAVSAFEAPGPNLIHAKERMTHDFYLRWVRKPMRFWPGTKMPQYAETDGTTTLRDVLEGNADRQFEAIWNYILEGERMVPPE
jgi:mono/diheme cytochrome c family protein